MNRTYRIESFGCKTSQSDALGYAGLLQRAGWKEATEADKPLLLLVQTCTVTMSADAQARQLLRKLNRENPQSKIVVTGCYAQRAEEELQQLKGVDYVIGNLNPRRYELLSAIAAEPVSSSWADFPMPAESSRTRPYIKIQDGCDARCSYCIIPSVRGASRSLPVDEVVRRVEYYRDRGYKEMILTGISMGGYGKELSRHLNLAGLMRRLDGIQGDFKIRLSSVEPEEIGQDFIDVFSGGSRFQPHLHLPLQSASDRVLKKMRRQYLFHHYDSIVQRLFVRVPELNLGTDILVGFPEETDEAFAETLAYVQSAPFAYCHVFPFSPRPGTPAATYKHAATDQTISERAASLRQIARQKNLAYRSRFMGRTLRALALYGAQSEALTDNYVRVQLNQPVLHDVLNVQIYSVSDNQTLAMVV